MSMLQRDLSGLVIIDAESIPIKKLTQTLRSVSLNDSLSACQHWKVEYLLSKLIHRFVRALEASVNNINTIGLWISDMLFHEATKPGEIGCDAWNTHDCAFSWRIAPWFIVGRKHTQVAAAHELFIIHCKQRAGALQELGMEDYFDTVCSLVEKFTSS